KLAEAITNMSIPEDLRYIVTRYNSLLSQAAEKLMELELSLQRASKLISEARLKDAERELKRAGVLLKQAEILVEELKDATTELTRRIPAARGLEESKAIIKLAAKLRDLISWYSRLLAELRAKLKEERREAERKQLIEPTLTLQLNSTRALVGGALEAKGTLTAGGKPLPGRTVKILLDGEVAATAETGEQGSYTAVLKIPLKYVSRAVAQAVYTPSPPDREKYTGASSDPVEIALVYYNTTLTLSSPREAHPGLEMEVKGSLSPGQPPRELCIWLAGMKLASLSSISESFTAKIRVPDIPPGAYELKAEVKPQGPYTGATAKLTLKVVKAPLALEVKAPRVALAPGSIKVLCNITSPISPPSGRAKLTLGGREAEAAFTSGMLEAEIEIPLATLSGPHTLRITAIPGEPWHSTAHYEARVYVLNTMNIAIAAIGLALAKPALKLPAKPHRRGRRREKQPPPPMEAEHTTAPMQLKPHPALHLYLTAAKLVEEHTQVRRQPHMTLREYYQATEEKLGEASKLFHKITMAVEEAVYSPRAVELAEVGELVAELERWLSES
ncbi:MAG: hypothetical protein DRN99_08800, partial [Thermoproteota archaeon]